jgi:Putative transposase
LLAILRISVPRSASSASCTPGTRSSGFTRRIKNRYAFFLPVKVLSRVFRGKFVAALKRAFRDSRLGFHGDLTLLAQPKTFSSWLRKLFRNDWVVYSKRPFGGPEHVLHYLGRYTHRVAISNHRLVSFADEKVTFRWRDSAHNNEQKLMTVSLDEFLRRFLLHLLPKGFVRIRHFGFLAHRRRAVFLPLCFHSLGSAPQEPQTKQEPSAADGSHALWFCPQCGGPMIILERLTADQIQLRSPPLISTAVA